MEEETIKKISNLWKEDFKNGIGDITLDQIYELAKNILESIINYDDDYYSVIVIENKKELQNVNNYFFNIKSLKSDLARINIEYLYRSNGMRLIRYCVEQEHNKAIKFLILHPRFWESSMISIEDILNMAEKEKLLDELATELMYLRTIDIEFDSCNIMLLSSLLLRKYNKLKESYDEIKEDMKYIPEYGEEYLKAKGHFNKNLPMNE